MIPRERQRMKRIKLLMNKARCKPLIKIFKRLKKE